MAIADKISQFIVHFSCTIPLKPDLKPSERESLKLALEDLDREHFQLFGNIIHPMNPNAPILFSAQRQYQIGPGIATAPSLMFEPSAITILYLIKIGDRFLTRDKELTGAEHNRKAHEALFRIQEILKVKFTRAGKAFEFVTGPFTSGEKKRILRNLTATQSDDICGLQSILNRAVQVGGKLLNLNTRVGFQQARTNDPFQLSVRIEINNRDHENSLEQRDVEYVWKEADKIIGSQIKELLNTGD